MIAAARLLEEGCKATLTSEGPRLEGPSGEVTPVVRYGSHVFLCPKLRSMPTSALSMRSLLRGLLPDLWLQLSSPCTIMLTAGYLTVPIKPWPAQALFSPEGTEDRPIDLKDLSNERTTYMHFKDGRTTSISDD